MFDEQIYRRFNHTAAACFIIFFLFPHKIFGLDRIYFAIILWIIILGIEYLRLNNKVNLLGMRDYEKDRVAGFVWFASGTFIIFGFTEMGAFPQSIAIATIIMAAYTDPVIGEANQKLGGNWGIGIGFFCSFLIYQVIIGVILYSVLGALVAVIAEKPRLKWFDDDLAMQIFPATILSILFLSGLGPEITETIVESL
jgi:tetrahydromethanopterin S-methyltransferase subunit G